MFKEIFNNPNIVTRHRSAPGREERESFLRHLANEGYARGSLAIYSRQLLSILEVLGCNGEVTEDQIDAAANAQSSQRQSFRRVARMWYQFLGRLRKSNASPAPFAEVVDDFGKWLGHERGLTNRTIETYCWHAKRFLERYAAEDRALGEMRIEDVDKHLVECSEKGWARLTIANRATAVRSLLNHASMRGWCSASIAPAIARPRIYDLEGLPVGPSWQNVAVMIAAADSGAPQDIRDRAILMLFAIYGLRVSEVAGLRLDDIDWNNERILVRRAKRRSAQSLPLVTAVGNAILQYIRECRSSSPWREIFQTLTVPFRPMSRAALYNVVRKRLDALKITSRRRGPHALRHACAINLVDQGLSLKEIGDHLGHQSSSSTRVYAKVNLSALRKVANIDLGGIL